MTAMDPLEVVVDFELGFRNPHPATDFERVKIAGGPFRLIEECAQAGESFTLTCPDGGKVEGVGVNI